METNRPLTISAQFGLIDQIDFFKKTVASQDLSSYYLLLNGEFAYNKSYSSEYPWGAIKRLDLYDKGALSSLYICFKPKGTIDSDYLVHYFESSKWHQGMANIAGEGARNHGLLNIAIPDFFNTIHYLPNVSEQRKIADFLNLIEERIAVQNKVIEDLKKLKTALCKKILAQISNSPITELGKHCSITTGKLDANAMKEGGEYMFFTCARENYRTDTYAFEGDALLISGNGELGLCKYYSGKFNAYQRTYVLQNFDIDIQYAKLIIDSFLPKKIYREKNVGAMPYIVLSTLSGLKIPIPNHEIQTRISSIISIIAYKIEIEERILTKLILTKNFVLSQLFI